jgi:thymidylate synthase (FAD)
MAKIVEPSYEILTKIDGMQILKHIEKIARTCYRSEGLITADGASAKKLITNLIKLGHEAMIEHFSISVRFICDIGFYKDLTGLRLASFAVESTRYCNYHKDKFGSELVFIKPVNITEGTPEYAIWLDCMNQIEHAYMEMGKMGCKPDQLRMLLPHSTKAEINITANLREWRHILRLRTTPAVHPSIRQLTIPLLRDLQSRMPLIFDDIPVQE